MNERISRGGYAGRGLATLALIAAVSALAAVGARSAAQEPKSTQATPAHQRGLREKPLAAGRNKAALAAETAAATAPPGMNMSKLDCGACHSCDDPNHQNPCLRLCPRSVAQAIADAAHEDLPADMILLKTFKWQERHFGPVPFNHKAHADMAGMAGGCQVCHHRTSPDKQHPACSTCHKPVFKPDADRMRMPGLKAAYHRQCMGCHRDWAHHTRCGTCHLPKGDQQEPPSADQVPTPGDIAAHPPIQSPEFLPYKTEYAKGPYVVFRHEDHLERYGYGCERCHKGQSCARCHEQAEEPQQTQAEVKQQRHAACFPCHEDYACGRCHSQQENPQPQYFDHAVTGFALDKYHEKLTCRACHRRLFFTRKLEGDCQFCHSAWTPDTFDHAVTGQVLDETHAEIDCTDCHLGSRFDAPPSCQECHDPDDRITFPTKRPGPLTATGQT